jgi:hypothetical protein
LTYRAFKEAKQFVHNLGLKSRSQWLQYCKSSEKPNDIPTYPQDSIYKSEWKGWGDCLGTGRIANQAIVYRPFEEARKFVHALRIDIDIIQWKRSYVATNMIRVYLFVQLFSSSFH